MKFSILTNPDLNLPDLDHRACSHCGENIDALYEVKKFKNGKTQRVRIRNNRIDCDAAVGEEASKYCTYHLDCWKALLAI